MKVKKLKLNTKKIKERAKKIAAWIQIECEISDIANLTKLPKEYELKTINDVLIIQEVERITSETRTDKKIKPGGKI